jgi:hypothetical protein
MWGDDLTAADVVNKLFKRPPNSTLYQCKGIIMAWQHISPEVVENNFK